MSEHSLSEPDGSLKAIVRKLSGLISIVTIPIAVYLTWLIARNAPGRIPMKIIGFGIWGGLNAVITAPFFLMSIAPDLLKFVQGQEPFRSRWLVRQFVAWISTLLLWCVLTAVSMHIMQKPFLESLVFTGFGTLIIGAGLYLVAMSGMDAGFFEADRMGMKVLEFLSTDSGEKAKSKSFYVSLAFVIIGAFINVVSVASFANSR